jgi:hypothetical protein
MTMRIDWQQSDHGCWVAKIGNITLCASPDRLARFGTKPARGTKWHAQCSIWDGKYTISRYGRDVYMDLQDSAKDAMRLAEQVYNEARTLQQSA